MKSSVPSHGTDKLAVSIDWVGLKPPVNPAHPDYVHRGMIHWDTDMINPPTATKMKAFAIAYHVGPRSICQGSPFATREPVRIQPAHRDNGWE